MKTLIARIAFLFAAAFSLEAARASGPAVPLPDPAAAAERVLNSQINRYVTYPLLDRTHNMDGEVVVSFVINTEGKIEVVDAHSTNPDLCEYVVGKLSKVDIGTNPSGLWKTTHLRFVFHPEA